MYLSISSGATEIVLSGTSPVRGCTYFPDTAQRSGVDWQDVTETAEVNLSGTATAIRSTTNALDALFLAAAKRQQTGMGERVFVNYKPVDADAATYRSEISAGRVVWSTNPGLRRLGDAYPVAQIAVIWTRAYWWEGALTEIALSASGQAAATGGRAIYNDPANGNWLQMGAGQVTGILPTPVMLEITNTTGGARNIRKLFLNVNANSDPANLIHYLQGEARLSGGTVENDATCSGGQSLDFVISGTPVTFAWTISQANAQRLKGRRVRVLARFTGTSGAMYIMPQVQTSTGVTLWSGDEVGIGPLTYEAWLDLGIAPIPPGGYDAAYAAHRLALRFRGTGLGNLDVLQLATTDSYCYLEMPAPGVAVANNAVVVYDGIEGRAYITTGGVNVGLPTSYSSPLLLQPGVIQRIYTLWQIHTGQTDGDAPIGDTASVRAYYRPRRLTV